MKEYTIVSKFKVTNEFYFTEVLELKKSILNGEFQRDLKKDEEGLKDVKITFELTKP